MQCRPVCLHHQLLWKLLEQMHQSWSSRLSTHVGFYDTCLLALRAATASVMSPENKYQRRRAGMGLHLSFSPTKGVRDEVESAQVTFKPLCVLCGRQLDFLIVFPDVCVKISTKKCNTGTQTELTHLMKVRKYRNDHEAALLIKFRKHVMLYTWSIIYFQLHIINN